MKVINNKTQKHLMKQHQERMQVVNLLAMCNVLYDKGYKIEDIQDFVIGAMEEMQRLAEEMINNTCVEHGMVRVDKEYNSDKLRQACEMYGIYFNKELYA